MLRLILMTIVFVVCWSAEIWARHFDATSVAPSKRPEVNAAADPPYADACDMRTESFYPPRPRSESSAPWNAHGKVTKAYSGGQPLGAAPSAGEDDAAPWRNRLFWLLPIGVLGLGCWLRRRS